MGGKTITANFTPDTSDPDGDGWTNYQEIVEYGTNPTLPDTDAIGKTYRIESSLDLSTWTTVEDGIAGNGSVIQRFYSTRDKPKGYFRVEEGTP